MSILVNTIGSNTASQATQTRPIASDQSERYGPPPSDGIIISSAPPIGAALGQSGENAQPLKNAGINTEIEYRSNGLLVLRYVDELTQQVVFQIPSRTVQSMVASLNQAGGSAQFDEQA
jgi:hypothetical protein